MQSAPKIRGDGTSYFIVHNSLLPSSNLHYDLGSSNARWNELYISSSTIHVGDSALKTNEAGGLVIENGGVESTVAIAEGETSSLMKVSLCEATEKLRTNVIEASNMTPIDFSLASITNIQDVSISGDFQVNAQTALYTENSNGLMKYNCSNLVGVVSSLNSGLGLTEFESGKIIVGNGASSGMYFDNTTSYLGIGTGAPLAPLHSQGSILVNNEDVTTSNIITLQSAGESVLVVDSDGNVGIGVTNPTMHKLHVVGDTRIEGDLDVNGMQTSYNSNVANTEQVFITNDGTGPALIVNQTGAQPILEVQDDGVPVLKIVDGGNVGIGTTTPLQKLHVQGKTLISYGSSYQYGWTGYRSNGVSDTSLTSVCYAPELSLFLAVNKRGSAGYVTKSSDGMYWLRSAITPTIYVTDLYGDTALPVISFVCWSSDLGIFVGISNFAFLTSSNGVNWTKRDIPVKGYWVSACWAPELGLFIAVAEWCTTGTYNTYTGYYGNVYQYPILENGGIMTSPDGITWTKRVSPLFIYQSVCWAPEIPLLVVSGKSGIILTSPDGITWTQATTPTNQQTWISVCWSPELHLFVTLASTNDDVYVGGVYITIGKVMTSPNGLTWTLQPVTFFSYDYTMGSVCWSPQYNIFLAVGTWGGNRVMTSPDGINWTFRVSSNDYNEWEFVIWAPQISKFVAVANYGTLRVMLSTTKTPSLSYLSGKTNMTDHMYVDGNVGIGTTSSLAKLHIEGSLKGTSLVSTIETGQSPLIVSSSTKITNLNANYVDGLDRNGLLEFTTRSNLPVFDYNPWTQSNTTTVVNPSSNIGIGTTTPSVVLDINSTDALLIPKGTSAQRPVVGVQAPGHLRYNTTNEKFEVFSTATSWNTFDVRSSDGFTNLTTSTNLTMSTKNALNKESVRATILSSGNIGIGTIVPANTCHVVYPFQYDTYPPTSLTGNTTTISGAKYGNGTYICSESSTYVAQNQSYRMFDNSYVGDAWWMSTQTYTQQGVYYGTSNTLVDSTQVAGEWAQIQIPSAINLTSYSIAPRYDSSGYMRERRSVRTWVLAGSTNGTTWSLVDANFKAAWTEDAHTEYVLSNQPAAYSYYRIIVKDVGNPLFSDCTHATIHEMKLYSNTVDGIVSFPNSHCFNVNNGASSKLSVAYSGKVGINKSIPTEVVDVSGNANTINLFTSGGVGIGTTLVTANLDIMAATSTSTSLCVRPGASLTAPISGAYEYDGDAMYATTSAVHGRGVLPSQMFTMGAGVTVATPLISTNYPIFPLANDAVSVVAATYRIRGVIGVVCAGTIANILRLSIKGAGSAITSSIAYTATATNGNAATPTGFQMSYITSDVAADVTSTSAAAATNRTISIEGIIRISVAGTLIPSVQFSAAPGGALSFKASNFLELTPMGSSSVSLVGQWIPRPLGIYTEYGRSGEGCRHHASRAGGLNFITYSNEFQNVRSVEFYNDIVKSTTKKFYVYDYRVAWTLEAAATYSGAWEGVEFTCTNDCAVLDTTDGGGSIWLNFTPPTYFKEHHWLWYKIVNTQNGPAPSITSGFPANIVQSTKLAQYSTSYTFTGTASVGTIVWSISPTTYGNINSSTGALTLTFPQGTTAMGTFVVTATDSNGPAVRAWTYTVSDGTVPSSTWAVLEASALSQNNNTTVSAWGTTRSFTQATEANKPTYFATGGYNNGPYVFFNRTNSAYLNAGSQTMNMSTNGGFTAVCLIKFTGALDYWERIFDFGNGPNSNNLILARHSNTFNYNFSMYDPRIELVTWNENPIVQEVWNVVTVRYIPNSKFQIFKNNVVISEVAISTNYTNRTFANTFIGRSNWSDPYLNAQMSKLFIYDRALSDSEMTNLYVYMLINQPQPIITSTKPDNFSALNSTATTSYVKSYTFTGTASAGSITWSLTPTTYGNINSSTGALTLTFPQGTTASGIFVVTATDSNGAVSQSWTYSVSNTSPFQEFQQCRFHFSRAGGMLFEDSTGAENARSASFYNAIIASPTKKFYIYDYKTLQGAADTTNSGLWEGVEFTCTNTSTKDIPFTNYYWFNFTPTTYFKEHHHAWFRIPN